MPEKCARQTALEVKISADQVKTVAVHKVMTVGKWCAHPCILKQITLSKVEVRSLLCNMNAAKDKML